MIDELEWKTRRDRINTKLKALNPSWNIVKYKPGMEISFLDRCAVEEFPTANGPLGLVNKTQVHPREVFADPFTDRASAIIVAHNHPIGDLTSRKEDIETTKQLKFAGEILGIRVLDHIIFNDKGYYSLVERGEIYAQGGQR